MKFNKQLHRTTVKVIMGRGQGLAIEADVRQLDNEYAELTIPANPDMPSDQLEFANRHGMLQPYKLPKGTRYGQIMFANKYHILPANSPYFEQNCPPQFTVQVPIRLLMS